MRSGLLAFGGDLFGEQVCQVVELFAGAIDDGFHVDQQQPGQLITFALLGEGEGLSDTAAISGEGLFELVI
ncbi:hypothetical protein D3C78_1831750 [compost metagenome]